MEYKIYKLKFTSCVHFGNKSLEDTDVILHADTIYSAMCHELVKQGTDVLEAFVDKTRSGKIVISDAFPYIGERYYIPKPLMKIEAQENEKDITLKKVYKKLEYIPVDQLDNYLAGKMDAKQEQNFYQDNIGRKAMRTAVSIRGEEETKPYRIGTYFFKENSGLYFIVGCEDEFDRMDMEDCFVALGLSGIGGKRNAGMGRFQLNPGKMNEDMLEKLKTQNASKYMLLSGALPTETELNEVLEKSSYLLEKRSGFVASSTYAQRQLRKKDLYVIKSGSCFEQRFAGDIYDVGDGGNHSVYRYAKPLFLGVNV